MSAIRAQGGYHDLCWPLLFTGSRQWPTVISTPIHTTLTTFDTSEPLDDPLCRLLRCYAPAVTRLRVRDIDLLDDHSHRQWGVRFLCLTQEARYYGFDEEEDTDDSVGLLRLPKCHSGATRVQIDLDLQAQGPEVRSDACWSHTQNDGLCLPARGRTFVLA